VVCHLVERGQQAEPRMATDVRALQQVWSGLEHPPIKHDRMTRASVFWADREDQM
jgi:hypothetical protein